jgi:cell wall-associated NlpC family hydrolase
LRVRALSTFIGSLTMLAAAAPAALAGGTGGASPSAPEAPSQPSTGQSPSTPPIHTAPVTARSPRLSYRGPVYQKLPSGEIVPYQAPLAAGQLNPATGGSPVGVTASSKPQLLVPGSLARYVHGLAAAPIAAPAAVQEMIWAGNQIIGLPYIFGGGHASFESPGYDCSGTVSFALHGAGLLETPEDSSELESYGSHGVGRWVTVFSNPGHAYVDVAGLRLDTSAADDPSNQQGPRWRPLRRANSGYTIRHPLGL